MTDRFKEAIARVKAPGILEKIKNLPSSIAGNKSADDSKDGSERLKRNRSTFYVDSFTSLPRLANARLSVPSVEIDNEVSTKYTHHYAIVFKPDYISSIPPQQTLVVPEWSEYTPLSPSRNVSSLEGIEDGSQTLRDCRGWKVLC